VRFSRGSSLLSSLATRPLGPVAGLLGEEPHKRIYIEGYAAEDEARALGLQRAQAVARYLQSQGVSAHRLNPIGLSEVPQSCTSRASCVRLTWAPAVAPEDALCFATCRGALGPEADSVLEDIAKNVSSIPFIKLAVEGHTNSAPTSMDNGGLATGRAELVAEKLQELGVRQNQLEVIVLSDKGPLCPQEHLDEHLPSCRVELHVLVWETLKQLRATTASQCSSDTLFHLALLVAGLGLQVGASVRRVVAEVLCQWGIPWTCHLMRLADVLELL